jgi:hypothetical protein
VKLLLVCAAVLAINIPFGYWRAGVAKLSWRWFLSVHLPVPLIILLRLWSGLGWHLSTFPLFVAAFFVGQLTGGKLRG